MPQRSWKCCPRMIQEHPINVTNIEHQEATTLRKSTFEENVERCPPSDPRTPN